MSNKVKFVYLCTECNEQVIKDPLVKPKVEGNTETGLGKWKCKCGNKKVRRVKVKEE